MEKIPVKDFNLEEILEKKDAVLFIKDDSFLEKAETDLSFDLGEREICGKDKEGESSRFKPCFTLVAASEDSVNMTGGLSPSKIYLLHSLASLGFGVL